MNYFSQMSNPNLFKNVVVNDINKLFLKFIKSINLLTNKILYIKCFNLFKYIYFYFFNIYT